METRTNSIKKTYASSCSDSEKYNRHPLDEEIARWLLKFCFVFIVIIASTALGLVLIGQPWTTVLSGAATAVCNVSLAWVRVSGRQVISLHYLMLRSDLADWDFCAGLNFSPH